MNKKLLELVEPCGFVTKIVVRRRELENFVDYDSSFNLEEGSLIFVLLSFLFILLVRILLSHHFFFFQVLFIFFNLIFHYIDTLLRRP